MALIDMPARAPHRRRGEALEAALLLLILFPVCLLVAALWRLRGGHPEHGGSTSVWAEAWAQATGSIAFVFR